MSPPQSAIAPTPIRDEEFFQRLADGAPVMIWMSGLDMGCFYFNRAWLEFRGRTLEQEAGNGWAEGVHPDDVERCVNHYVGCFERRIAFAMTYRLRDHAGEYRWILDRGSPHYLPDETFLGFYGGCAEIEQQAPDVRNAELRTSLASVREFARKIATQEVSTLRAFKSQVDRPLQIVAQDLHAAAQLEQLATDMLTFGKIPPGACVP